jgi:hypothetical protein
VGERLDAPSAGENGVMKKENGDGSTGIRISSDYIDWLRASRG